MLEERTIIDQIEICQDGVVRIRFAIQIIRDGEVISNAWHRTSLPEDLPIEMQLEEVEKHLKEMGRQEFPREEFVRVRKFYDLNKQLRGNRDGLVR